MDCVRNSTNEPLSTLYQTGSKHRRHPCRLKDHREAQIANGIRSELKREKNTGKGNLPVLFCAWNCRRAKAKTNVLVIQKVVVKTSLFFEA
jgi:hypothetical protein